MAFPFSSRKETYDSNTPSDLSIKLHVGATYPSRRSLNGATTIQSDQVSISNSSAHANSSVHTTAISEDLFNYTEQDPDGGHFDRKSFHSLEKPTSRRSHSRNQSQDSQSTVSTIREAESVRSSTAGSSSTRPSDIHYFEDEDGSPDDTFLRLLETSTPISDEAPAREGRVLESKVAQVASRKFSVEDVTALQREVDRWLTEGRTATDDVRFLSPSSSSSLATYYSASNSPQHSS
jgi:hypothetical protein